MGIRRAVGACWGSWLGAWLLFGGLLPEMSCRRGAVGCSSVSSNKGQINSRDVVQPGDVTSDFPKNVFLKQGLGSSCLECF